MTGQTLTGLDHRFVRADSFWIPAFAGMTKKSPEIAVVCHSRESGNPDGAEASSMRFGRNDDQGPLTQHSTMPENKTQDEVFQKLSMKGFMYSDIIIYNSLIV
ncbi:MAG: hypothetical protein HQL79_09325 [Magnetococcales bacterium]|nr:hypothetical protein [Magnetococcales bacterium]